MYRAFVLLLIIVFCMTGCSRKEEQGSSEHKKLTIAVTAWPASAAFYVAHEKGYFKDEGLDATLQQNLSGHLGLDAVFSGKADLATAGETPIARAVIDGKPLAVIATVCEIDRAILIIARKDIGISSRDDLRGRRIGVVAGTTADFFLQIYLATSYIDPKDVRVVNLTTDKVVDALLNGEVDAVSTWAPHTVLLRDKLGGNAVVLHDPSIYTMTWDIVATQDFVKKNPECIKRLLRAIVRANQFIAEQPSDTRAICSKHIGADSPLFEREWADYGFTVELDQSLVLNLEDQARWISKRGGVGDRKAINFMDFIDAEGLKAVKPEAVTITGK
jgi:NitT/TauT family transport system substrate-binding protein